MDEKSILPLRAPTPGVLLSACCFFLRHLGCCSMLSCLCYFTPQREVDSEGSGAENCASALLLASEDFWQHQLQPICGYCNVANPQQNQPELVDVILFLSLHSWLSSSHPEISGCATDLGEEKEGDSGGNGRGIHNERE